MYISEMSFGLSIFSRANNDVGVIGPKYTVKKDPRPKLTSFNTYSKDRCVDQKSVCSEHTSAKRRNFVRIGNAVSAILFSPWCHWWLPKGHVLLWKIVSGRPYSNVRWRKLDNVSRKSIYILIPPLITSRNFDSRFCCLKVDAVIPWDCESYWKKAKWTSEQFDEIAELNFCIRRLMCLSLGSCVKVSVQWRLLSLISIGICIRFCGSCPGLLISSKLWRLIRSYKNQ